jgi:hypothetical protein
MPEKIPEKSREFIEMECLKVARGVLGCSHLQAVRIGSLRPAGSGPNWEVFGFSPKLPPLAHDEAVKAIAPLQQRYALMRSEKG